MTGRPGQNVAATAARITAAILLAIGGIMIGGWIVVSYGHNDFAHYYLSSRLLASGGLPYGVRLDGLPWAHGLILDAGVHYGTDTPAFLALFAPLAVLPPVAAYYLWALLQLASLGAVIVLSLHLVEGQLPTWAVRTLAAAIVLAFSVWNHFLYSQTQLFLLALVLAAFHLSVRGRHAPALLVVTAAGLLKLYPFALLPWFAVRASREAGWRPLLPAAGLAVAALAVAPGLWAAFLTLGLPHVASYVAGPYPNVSLAGTVGRTLREAAGLRLGDTGVRILWAVLAAGVLGGAYAGVWRHPSRPERELAALVCAMLLAAPVAWAHYLVWVAPPFVLLAADVGRAPSPRRLGVLLAVYLLTVGAFNLLLTQVLHRSGGLATALGAPTTLALLLLGGWFALAPPLVRSEPAPGPLIASPDRRLDPRTVQSEASTGPSGR